MCPSLNDQEIVALLDDRRARFDAGDSLAEARLGVGRSCLEIALDEESAVTCALCEIAVVLQVWSVEDPLPTMCPWANDEEIAAALDDRMARFDAGDSLAEARSGTGGYCLEMALNEEDAIICSLCDGAVVLQIWGE